MCMLIKHHACKFIMFCKHVMFVQHSSVLIIIIHLLSVSLCLLYVAISVNMYKTFLLKNFPSGLLSLQRSRDHTSVKTSNM